MVRIIQIHMIGYCRYIGKMKQSPTRDPKRSSRQKGIIYVKYYAVND